MCFLKNEFSDLVSLKLLKFKIFVSIFFCKFLTFKKLKLFQDDCPCDNYECDLPTTTTAIGTTPMTTASVLETTESETEMSTTPYSTASTVTTTTVLSTTPTTSPTNTTILIVYYHYSQIKDNYLLYPDGGNNK